MKFIQENRNFNHQTKKMFCLLLLYLLLNKKTTKLVNIL